MLGMMNFCTLLALAKLTGFTSALSGVIIGLVVWGALIAFLLVPPTINELIQAKKEIDSEINRLKRVL
jgi:uncharacterized membrane protein YfcA